MHVRAEAAVKLEESLHQQRRQQKRYGQSQRIYRKQKNPLHHSVLLACDGEDRRQNWTEAGSPAEGKCESNNERADRRTAAFHTMQTRVGIKRLDLENTRQMQAKQNDDD